MALPSGQMRNDQMNQDEEIQEGQGNIEHLGQNRQPQNDVDDQLQKKRQKQSQKIKKLQMKKQQQKEQTLSTSKLLAKTQALRITVEEKEIASTQTARYFHICIDKLSLAFEKQFLKELPEYGNFKRQDQEYSPTSYKMRKDVYGYQETQSANSQLQQSKVKSKDILACAQATVINVGQHQKSAAPAITHDKKLGGKLAGSNPFFQAAVTPLQKKQSMNSAQNYLSENGFAEEIVEYTVYKSKIEFDRLRKTIKFRENLSTVINLLLLLIFGVLEIILVIFAFIYAREKPFLGIIALSVASSESIEMSDSSNINQLVLDSFVFSIIKSFTIIVWYFLSNYFIKQRKVTTIMKIKRWYYLQFFVWFVCFFLQVFYSVKGLSVHAENQSIDSNQLYLVFGAFTFIFFMMYTGMSILFIFKLSSYNRSMIDFHKFINSYRQTPRSRNLKKYKPPQEPIYEEISQFERSHFGSIQIPQSEVGSEIHGGTQSQNRNRMLSSQNDTRDVVSVNNQTMSMHGAQQSAIEFNEHTGQFEEVPVDEYRGSFPDEMNMSAPQRGFDIPDSEQSYPAKKGSISSKKSIHLKKVKQFMQTNDMARQRSHSKATDDAKMGTYQEVGHAPPAVKESSHVNQMNAMQNSQTYQTIDDSKQQPAFDNSFNPNINPSTATAQRISEFNNR